MSDENNKDGDHQQRESPGSIVWKIVFILAPWVIIGLLGAAWAYL